MSTPARPPGILQRIGRYLLAALRERAAEHRGDPQMDPAEIARRHAICRTNACGQYLAAADQCAACGCHVGKKVAWRTASCPRGHWAAVTPVVIPPRPGPPAA